MRRVDAPGSHRHGVHAGVFTGPAGERATMELGPDELAGIVDALGGLSPGELRAAVDDLAARAGATVETDLDAAIAAALDRYFLVEVPAPDGVDVGDENLLVAGPAALPTLPEGGEDLPHLLDVGPRPVDREAAALAVEDRLRADAARAIDEGDTTRAPLLLDACYEVEAWGPVDLDDVKTALADLEG